MKIVETRLIASLHKTKGGVYNELFRRKIQNIVEI